MAVRSMGTEPRPCPDSRRPVLLDYRLLHGDRRVHPDLFVPGDVADDRIRSGLQRGRELLRLAGLDPVQARPRLFDDEVVLHRAVVLHRERHGPGRDHTDRDSPLLLVDAHPGAPGLAGAGLAPPRLTTTAPPAPPARTPGGGGASKSQQ